MTTRWDIINFLIQKYQYKKYLEIGYYKGWSFDAIKCENKIAVDPYPCKTPEQEKVALGDVINDEYGTIWKIKSDDYFSVCNETFDIIFIDGLHEAAQVYIDIQNSIKVLNNNGLILLHDCNPPKYKHTTIGIEGAWTGDTYLGFIKYRRENPSVKSFTINTDWGIGIINPFESLDTWEDIPEDIDWEFFDKNRDGLLNLKSVEEGIKLL